MDEETKKNLFVPFFTTKGAMAKDDLNIKGTGLGLSITLTIIQNHDGTIYVESEKEKGSTFVIRLPASESDSKIESVEKEVQIAGEIFRPGNMRILVVDDERDMTDLMLKFFKKSGYKDTVVVNSGRKALSLFKKTRYDAVFLDVLLPDINGEEILLEMLKISPDTRIVFISGQIGVQEDKFIEKGAYAFMRKPFDMNQVIEIIGKIANERRQKK
jgi:CheY-like chemotaxis protein